MFIRKKKMLQEIEDMIEDCYYWKEFWAGKNEPYYEKDMDCAVDELDTLRYFLLHNERWRELKKRKGIRKC